MNIRGEDVASSVREWVKEDIKKGPSARHELGKFLVGVSTGTVGLFATLLKFAVESPCLDFLTVACFITLLLSMLVGLFMAVPPVMRIREDMDLFQEYNSIVCLTINLIAGWLALWMLGFILGIAKLFQ